MRVLRKPVWEYKKKQSTFPVCSASRWEALLARSFVTSRVCHEPLGIQGMLLPMGALSEPMGWAEWVHNHPYTVLPTSTWRCLQGLEASLEHAVHRRCQPHPSWSAGHSIERWHPVWDACRYVLLACTGSWQLSLKLGKEKQNLDSPTCLHLDINWFTILI